MFTKRQKRQEIHRQRKDVVEGQGGQDRLSPLFNLSPRSVANLLHVGQNVTVRQHRAFRNAGCAARVLQQSDIIEIQFRPFKFGCVTF